MTEFSYQLSFANTPFLIDQARVIRAQFDANTPGTPEPDVPEKHQPLADLIDELDRLMPFCYLADFAPPSDNLGRNLNGVSSLPFMTNHPTPEVKIGDWYYPNTASHWSVFRGLATSTQVKAMLAATGGFAARTFIMKSIPSAPRVAATDFYSLSSQMFMLPPRPLAEHGAGYDGLYLVTLVDERFYWQFHPQSFRPTSNSTWATMFAQLATSLGVTITFDPGIETVAAFPQLDSQLWANAESAAVLFDALAFNIGCTVVRNMNGTYVVMDPLASRTIAEANRGNAQTVSRMAGGDLFYSGSLLPVGNLTPARNAIVPTSIDVTFPKYVVGDDPVPHFINQRTQPPQRPSVWIEDSYGDVHTVNVPIASGGATVSGYTGIGRSTIQTAAKSLFSGEVQAISGGTPLNASGLTALAMFLAKDRYDSLAAVAINETYPGTFAWTPEGVHDIVWTYSAKLRRASTRVIRTEWNNNPLTMQNAGAPLSGSTITPKGVGGPLVAQTARDAFGSGITATLNATLASNGTVLTLNSGTVSGLPSNYRWKAAVNNEVMLVEGLSGGWTPSVVYRAVDGTLLYEHANGSQVRHVTPNTTYGVNLVTFADGLQAAPGAWTSGGIQEVIVRVADGGIVSGMIGSGVIPTSGITIVVSGTVYSGAIFSGLLNSGTIIITSGMYGSGVQILSGMIGSGAINSGEINSGAINVTNLNTINWTLNFPTYFTWQYSGVYFLLSGQTIIDPGNLIKLRMYGSGDVAINGIAGGVPGRIIILWNAGTGKVTLIDQASGLNGILLPVGGTQLASSGYTSGYVVWPRNGCILEYDGISGHWRFDHPTMAAGDYGSVGFAGLGPPVDYAIQHLRFGSGLLYETKNDGSANVYVRSGIGGSTPTVSGYDWQSYRHARGIRSDPADALLSGVLDTYYLGGMLGTSTPVAGSKAANTIWMSPFISPRNGTIDQMAFELTTLGLSGQKVKMGIYESVNNFNLYPSALVVDVPELTSGMQVTGLKSIAIGFTPNPNKLYWLAYVADNIQNVKTIPTIGAHVNVLGVGANSGGFKSAWTSFAHEYTYDGTLPDPFPTHGITGAYGDSTALIALGLRYTSGQ